MKLKKKLMSLALVVAMAVCMLPVSKAKAANTAYTWSFANSENTNDYFAVSGSSSTNKSSDFASGLKLDSNNYIQFTVTEGKYAKVDVWANCNSDGQPSVVCLVSDSYSAETDEISVYHGKGANAAVKCTYSGYITGGTYYVGMKNAVNKMVADAATTSNTKQSMLYQVVVTEYDTVGEVPEDVVDTTTYVNVSGTITSEVDLTDGKVSLKSATKQYTATISAGANANEYTYTAEDVAGDGAEYTVSVNATGLNEATKVVSAIAPTTITVNTEDVTNANFTISYDDIRVDAYNTVWDFGTGKFEAYEIQGSGKTGTYKGLSIATEGGKFSVRESDVQVNAGTTISIPVTGKGTVVVDLKNDAGFTLGGEANTTYDFDNSVDSVDLVITENDYLLSIAIAKDEDTEDTEYAYTYVQYKQQDDDKFTLRFVSAIEESVLEDINAAGFALTVAGETEVITGQNVFKSIYANGEVVNAADGCVFVVVEVANVPAGTVFTDIKLAYELEDGSGVAAPDGFTYTTPEAGA
ncbi:MAG: hypothetical protein IKL73_04465 [Lachnospiraceae bacterium]|nr:hypothetical protein [Lachnospiraceae bacterium]